MKGSIRSAIVVAAISSVVALRPNVAAAQQQQAAPMPNFPAVGEAAPDFSATATDSTGKAIPVSLSSMKGKVVVLAFYPLDRSSGCTIELSKFRDDYKNLFGNGVVV